MKGARGLACPGGQDAADQGSGLLCRRADRSISIRAGSCVLSKLRGCLGLPESSEGSQFGTRLARRQEDLRDDPLRRRASRCAFGWESINPGHDRRPAISDSTLFGHNGWIALDVQQQCDWREIHSLALQSYRHFALKRMLQLLGAD